MDNLHIVSDDNAQRNKDNSYEVYIFEGNVFVKNLANKSVKQMTYTSAVETDALFLTNGNIAYRVDNIFFTAMI